MAALARANGATGAREAATAIGAARSSAPGTERPFWREALAPYARPHLGRSLLDIATSIVPYLALSVLMYLALDVSYLLVLALAIPAAGFLLRTYIVFHDCAHGSFLPSKRANAWLGVVLGLVVYAPFVSWRHSHAVHHATAGDLDRRGVGDVLTLTVAEYRASPWRRRLGYRLFRNPLVMFGLGPIYATAPAAAPGLPIGAPAHPAQRDRDEHRARGAGWRRCAGWWGGASTCSCRCRPPCSPARRACGCSTCSTSSRTPTGRARATGATPTRRCRAAAISSCPKVLQFFTGNIGLHHVHHLSTRIPNYNLQRAHDENPIFHEVPTLSLWDGLRAVRLKLWDEDRGRLVTFAEARAD